MTTFVTIVEFNRVVRNFVKINWLQRKSYQKTESKSKVFLWDDKKKLVLNWENMLRERNER